MIKKMSLAENSNIHLRYSCQHDIATDVVFIVLSATFFPGFHPICNVGSFPGVLSYLQSTGTQLGQLSGGGDSANMSMHIFDNRFI